MSRIEGATALGLHGVCKLYLEEEWQHGLRSYGIFGILDDEEVDRLRPVKVKREPDSAGSPTTLVQVQEPATSSIAQGNTSKRRKTELARASEGPGSPRDACQCSGACGSKACGTRRNSLVRQKLEVPCPTKLQSLGAVIVASASVWFTTARSHATGGGGAKLTASNTMTTATRSLSPHRSSVRLPFLTHGLWSFGSWPN